MGMGGVGGKIIFCNSRYYLQNRCIIIYWFSKVLAVKANSKALRPGEMHEGSHLKVSTPQLR